MLPLRKSNTHSGESKFNLMSTPNIDAISNNHAPKISYIGGDKIIILTIAIEKIDDRIDVKTTYDTEVYLVSLHPVKTDKTLDIKSKNKLGLKPPVKKRSFLRKSIDYVRGTKINSTEDMSYFPVCKLKSPDGQTIVPHLWNRFLITIRYYLSLIEEFDRISVKNSSMIIKYIPDSQLESLLYTEKNVFVTGDTNKKLNWESVLKLDISTSLKLARHTLSSSFSPSFTPSTSDHMPQRLHSRKTSLDINRRRSSFEYQRPIESSEISEDLLPPIKTFISHKKRWSTECNIDGNSKWSTYYSTSRLRHSTDSDIGSNRSGDFYSSKTNSDQDSSGSISYVINPTFKIPMEKSILVGSTPTEINVPLKTHEDQILTSTKSRIKINGNSGAKRSFIKKTRDISKGSNDSALSELIELGFKVDDNYKKKINGNSRTKKSFIKKTRDISKGSNDSALSELIKLGLQVDDNYKTNS